MQNDEIKEILDKLLDYITNLQQENKTQHENNQNMQEEMARVWEENERLKEELVKIPRAKMEYDLELEDYKSRCEKATEYINDKKIYDEEYGEFIYYNYLIHDRLLNILQNGSE